MSKVCRYGSITDNVAREGLPSKADLVDGVVPSSQLPSYVDDVLEYKNSLNFPDTGESGKIYMDASTGKIYRWSGTSYVIIGNDLTLGETSSTAYAGDKGKELEYQASYISSEMEDRENDIENLRASVPPGIKIFQNGVDMTDKVVLDIVNVGGDTAVSTLPYTFESGAAVVYNDEVHILGGTYKGSTYHYKWDGSAWINVSTLPYKSRGTSAVVYNNEIHLLGGADYYTCHYKWNGTEWTSVGTLPYSFYYGGAVVYNNEIHILGSSYSGKGTCHFKYNGTEWTSVSTLPYSSSNSSAVVYNGEIHLLGGSSGGINNHFKWDGTEWTSVSTLPYQCYGGAAIVYNDELHLLGAINPNMKRHIKLKDGEWVDVSTLPFQFHGGCGVLYNGGIRLLCRSYDYIIREDNFVFKPIFLS